MLLLTVVTFDSCQSHLTDLYVKTYIYHWQMFFLIANKYGEKRNHYFPFRSKPVTRSNWATLSSGRTTRSRSCRRAATGCARAPRRGSTSPRPLVSSRSTAWTSAVIIHDSSRPSLRCCHSSLLITVPEIVLDLRCEESLGPNGLYDVTVSWGRPEYSPDSYIVSLLVFLSDNITECQRNVSGVSTT